MASLILVARGGGGQISPTAVRTKHQSCGRGGNTKCGVTRCVHILETQNCLYILKTQTVSCRLVGRGES